jgi:L-fuculose-phosphate aldolase
VRTIPESWVFLQDVPSVEFGSHLHLDKDFNIIEKFTSALIIENDSVMITGDQLLQTFDYLEVAEFTAKSIVLGNALGKMVPINDQQVEELRIKFLN